MAENNGKKYYIATLMSLLLLLAVAFFLLMTLLNRQDSYRPSAKEVGYIDADAVYRSNKSYNIAKKEIDEYSARINRELTRALAHEKNSAKRQQLKREANREIAFYAETLLQDIDKDVNDAINMVADSKNLKRVYVSGVAKKEIKNVTNEVIAKLNQTLSDRLAGYIEEVRQDKITDDNKVWQKQFNFNAYPVANAPEKGITVNFSRRLVKAANSKGTIVAGTQPPAMDEYERFVWQRANWMRPAKKAAVTMQVSKIKPNVVFGKSANIDLPTSKTDAIMQGYASTIAFINSRNQAISDTEMSVVIEETKTAAAQKHQPQNSFPEISCVKIKTPQGKAVEVIAAAQYGIASISDFMQTRNSEFAELMLQKGNAGEIKTVVCKQQPQMSVTNITSAKIELPRDKNEQIIAALQSAVARTVGFVQERNGQIAELMSQKGNTVAKNRATQEPSISKNITAAMPSYEIVLCPGQITGEHIGAFLSLAGSKICGVGTMFKNQCAKFGWLAQNSVANMSADATLRFEKMRDIKAQATTATKQRAVKKAEPILVTAAEITMPERKTDKIITVVYNVFANTRECVKKTSTEPKEMPAAVQTTVKPEAAALKTKQQTAETKNAAAQKQQDVHKIDMIEKPAKTAEEKIVNATESEITKKTAEKSESDKQEQQESAEQPKTEEPVAKRITIQIAACRNKIGAESAVSNMHKKGLPGFLQSGSSRDGGQWWYVRIAAQNEAQAKSYIQKLTAMGYSPVAVRKSNK